ncbi:hypothetical protein [Nocardia sp. NPDC003726]
MTTTEIPFAANDPVPYWPVDHHIPGVRHRAEWAIELPNKQWWRKPSLRAIDPNGTDPSVFHSRRPASDELLDVIEQAVTVYGVRRRDYRPRLMVRAVVIGSAGVTTGPWQPSSTLAAAKAVR